MVKVYLILMVYLLFPILIVSAFHKWHFLQKIGTVILAYAVGVVLALTGVVAFEPGSAEATTFTQMQNWLMNLSVPIAIPLMLFGCNFKLWTKSLPKTVFALVGGTVAVLVAVVSGFFVFRRGRLGNALGTGLMKMLSVDKVNALYDRHSSVVGPEFAREVLDDLGIGYEVIHKEILDTLPDGPFITISNHPYGSLDGVMLVDLFGHIRPDFKVMVNRFLGRIKALESNFICVTPNGSERSAPTKDSVQGIRDAIAHIRDGHPLGIFPSGAVSDLSIKDRCIRDRQWQEAVLRLIKKMNVPVVPVHFLDRNSNFYYSLGLIDWRIRLLRLPAEVFNKNGKKTRIAIGQIITPQQQEEIRDLEQFGLFLRNKVYNQF